MKKQPQITILQMNHRLRLGYEREVLEGDRWLKNAHQELSDAIPQNLLIQCEWMNVVSFSKKDDRPAAETKIVDAMDNWNGLRLDVKIYEEDKG